MFLRRPGQPRGQWLSFGLICTCPRDWIPCPSTALKCVPFVAAWSEGRSPCRPGNSRSFGDRNSVSTRVDATRERAAMEFGQYHGEIIRRRGSAGFRLWLDCVAGDRRDSSARGLLLRAVFLKQVLLEFLRGLRTVHDEVVIGARHGGRVPAFFFSGVPEVDGAGAPVYFFGCSVFFPRTSFCARGTSEVGGTTRRSLLAQPGMLRTRRSRP